MRSVGNLWVLWMILPDGSSGTDPVACRSVSHALYDGLAEIVNLLGVTRTKGGRNGGTVVHPPLQLELADELFAVGLRARLCHLVTTDVGLVEVVHKVDGELNEEIPLRRRQVGVVEPVVKVRVRPEPKHRV